MKFGYDLYEVVSNDILSLLKIFKDEHITVFQLNKVDDYFINDYLLINMILSLLRVFVFYIIYYYYFIVS